MRQARVIARPIVGAGIMLGLAAAPAMAEGMDMTRQRVVQAIAVAAVAAGAAIGTLAILAVTRASVGLRVDEETEIMGLDITAHGERAYDL